MTVTPILTGLDDAILEHAAAIVFSQSKPFSFKDFGSFEVNGRIFTVKYGTFRNHISKLRGLGMIELAYNSGMAFYTLPGHKFGKQPMTPTPRGGQQRTEPIDRTIEREIARRPFQEQALHDIRLHFNVRGIWEALSLDSDNKIDPSNKDLKIAPRKSRDGRLEIRITVHRTDNITVFVACSADPIVVDYSGIIRLSNELTVVEYQLEAEVRKNLQGIQTLDPIIPDHMTWTLKQYHIGRDSIEEYDGKRFNYTYGDIQAGFVRAYAKEISKSRTILRIERQESPKRQLADVLNDFLEKSAK